MSNSMVPNDRIQCYLDLSRQSLDKFFQRRQFEWKFNLTLWTPIAIVIGFALQGGITVDVFSRYFCLTTLLHSLVFLLYVYWSMGLHSANLMDKTMSEQFTDALIDYVTDTSPKPNLRKISPPVRHWFWPLKDWSSAVQIAITFCLLLLSWFVLGYSQRPPGQATEVRPSPPTSQAEPVEARRTPALPFRDLDRNGRLL